MERFVVGLVTLALFCGAFLTGACLGNPASDAEPFSIAWNYDTSGYLATCGCSAHQLGGLARRATIIDNLREAQPLLAIEGAHIVADAGEFQLFKAETVVIALNKMGYDALMLGVREAQHGVQGIQVLQDTAEFPCFSANLLVDGTPWETPSVVVEIGGISVGVTGVSQPEAANFELAEGMGFREPGLALNEALNDLAGQGVDLTVLCLEGERSWIRGMIAQFETEADLFLAGDRHEATANYDFNPNPPALNNWQLGKRVGVVSVDPVPRGFSYSGTSIDLDDEVPDREDIATYLDDIYIPQLKERFFGTMKVDLEQPYMPPKSCMPCHEEAYEVYEGSRHSQALDTLLDRGQLYNPECMPCHVVYDNYYDELKPLNCISCHSNITEDHLWAAVKGEVERPEEPVTAYTFEWCVQCHDETNSVPFLDHWPQYVQHVYHGGDMSAAEAAAERMDLDIAAELPE